MTQQKILSSQLADSGVVPGAYTSSNVTVDAAGRITAIANGSSSPIIPLNEIPYGTGSGITSEPALTYNPTTNTVNGTNIILTGDAFTPGTLIASNGISTVSYGIPNRGYIYMAPNLYVEDITGVLYFNGSDNNPRASIGWADTAGELRYTGTGNSFDGYLAVGSSAGPGAGRGVFTPTLKILSTGGIDASGEGTAGQVLTSGGPGNPLTWTTASGSISAPVNEIVYGTGAGTTSDPAFTYDSGTDTLTIASAGPGLITTDAGQALTIQPGGALNLYSGTNPTGSNLTITAGLGSAGNGGQLDISAGQALGGQGGNLTIAGGSAVTGSFAGGAVSISAGTSTGTVQGGIAILQGGASVAGKGGDVLVAAGLSSTPVQQDGGLTLQAGQSGHNGGHVKVMTNGTERLRIGSQGTWKINGTSGGAGQVLTSNGPAATPTWEDAGGGGGYLFVASLSASGVTFNGSPVTTWTAGVSSTASYCHWDAYSSSIIFDTAGEYRISIIASASGNGSWPDGLTSYGTTVTNSNSNYETRHSSYAAAYPNNFQGIADFTSAPYQYNEQWTDVFVFDRGVGQSQQVGVYAANYPSSGSVLYVQAIVIVELIGPPGF
jgi:hypothetical protein